MLAHVHVMKTAGQTLREILRQSFTGQHCDLRASGNYATAADLRWALQVYPQLKSIAGHHVVPYSDLEDVGRELRYFTFFREPVARFASHYQFGCHNASRLLPFDEFLDRFANLQTRHIASVPQASAAIEMLQRRIGFVGLMEKFNESLVLLKHWSGEPLELPCHSQNIAPSNDIKQRLLSDPRSVERIRAAHSEDLRLYDYARDVIYPRQVARFGPGLAAAVSELTEAEPAANILSFSRLLATAKRDLLYKPLTKSPHRKAA